MKKLPIDASLMQSSLDENDEVNRYVSYNNSAVTGNNAARRSAAGAKDVVTYNLKDLSAASGRQQSLGEIFGLLDKAKPNKKQHDNEDMLDCEEEDNNKENVCLNKDIELNSQELQEAVEKEGLFVFKKEGDDRR